MIFPDSIFIFKCMEKEEQLLKKRFLELAETCFRRDVPTNTDFLNLSEQTIFQSVSGMLPPVRFVLSGGFESSERKVLCFLPSYMVLMPQKYKKHFTLTSIIRKINKK